MQKLILVLLLILFVNISYSQSETIPNPDFTVDGVTMLNGVTYFADKVINLTHPSGIVIFNNDGVNPVSIDDIDNLEEQLETTLTPIYYSVGVYDIQASDSVFNSVIGLVITDNSNDGNRYFQKIYFVNKTIIRCEIRDQNGFVTDGCKKFTIIINQNSN